MKIQKKPPRRQHHSKSTVKRCEGCPDFCKSKHPPTRAVPPALKKPARTAKSTARNEHKSGPETQRCNQCAIKAFCKKLYHVSGWCKSFVINIDRYHDEIMTIMKFTFVVYDLMSKHESLF